MKTIMSFIRKKNMLFKIILSYALIGFLFMTVFSYAILQRVSSNLKSEINETSTRMIDQSYNTADILLTSTFNYYSQLFLKNEFISSALNGKDFSSGEIYSINTQLSNFKQTNPLVSSIYVYNHNAGIVFSSALTFSTIEDFVDKDMTEMLRRKNLNEQGIFIPRVAKLAFPNSSSIETQNVISVIYSNMRADGRLDSMVLNLDQAVLQELIMKGSGDGSHKMMIINDQGLIISRPDGINLKEDDSYRIFMKTIIDSNDKRGHMLSTLGGTTYMVSYVKADRLGWNFIILSNYEELLDKVKAMQSFILGITLLGLAAMAITSAFFTKIIYIPIYQLIKKTITAAETKDKPILNEYDLLNKSFSLLENKVNTLQTDIKQSVSASKQSLLRSILHGTIGNKTETYKAMKKHELGTESDRYVVCVLKIDNFYKMSEKYDMVDISLLKFAIENISREIVSRRYKLEILEDGHDSLDLIFNIGPQDEQNDLGIEDILAEIQLNVEKFLKMTVTASIGPVAEKLEDMKISRLGAYQAVHFRLVYGTNSLISYDDILSAETKDYQYPAQLEKQIMISLKAGEVERLQELSSEFIAAIHPFKYDEIILSLLQLLVMTIRTAKGMSSFDREDADLEIHTCQQELTRWDTLEQIESWYFSLCERIIAIRDKESRSKNSKTIEKVVEYINEHYTDPNLSVDMLSNLIGLTASYVRKLFKDEMGKSVAEYMAELRFHKAQELLLKTDHPAKKVGEMVGFDNTSYFYVSFKKHVGMTPDHFRRENKLVSMSND
ncbi:AraC family transcriptional regulator [Paenibacillus sp. Soil787]|uniref:AraC family transcriptional regulator n=1 Tax=Paenibacillus sp. Soil787 TaxID=1736411 RepID=UPI0006FEC2B8|nr:AraC family transcriptional regulator [Paenibacillus sp. Soil787]KRF42246.1 hypothetical protein ASG93_21365 [Paenibacillus sp. Soil787]